MFRENTKHQQRSLFSAETLLSETKRRKMQESEERYFYQLIFCNICERDFSVLYSEEYSRPNAPVNTLVGALLLMQRRGWTYEELFRQIDFNLLTRLALGLRDLEETPFNAATLFNFQNRVAEHFVRSGENLLESVFDKLTAKQLKALKLKTNIQRTDSFLAASNIRAYGRLQLLIELVLRIYHVLSDDDKALLAERAGDYLNKTSGQYIYRLQKEDLPTELERLGGIYHWIATNLAGRYAEVDIFRTFQRVYAEHFTVVEDKVAVVPTEQLSSSCVQSPDDLEATYRQKGEVESRGESINIVETCHPDNPFNLIVDVAVNPNNKDDSVVLQERMAKLKEKTPELAELHFDGGYGSPQNDRLMSELEIQPVQTGIRGPTPAVAIEISEVAEKVYAVSCPYQQVHAEEGRRRYRARFDKRECANCPLAHSCPTTEGNHYRTYYFTHTNYLAQARHRQIKNLPEERQQLRANIEATGWEFLQRMPRGKLKVRGYFKTTVFVFSTAIGVNFGRIYRYLLANTSPEERDPLCESLSHQLKQCQRAIFTHLRHFWGKLLSANKSFSRWLIQPRPNFLPVAVTT